MQRQKINLVNIRATSLNSFWGNKYDKSIYLWEGSKHDLLLDEIINSSVPTFEDNFKKSTKNHQVYQECKKIYIEILPKIGKQLNQIHKLNYPYSFWRTTLGYWLFRHICIVYDKFATLQHFDVDKTDISLLNNKSFYIPDNHYDYMFCFANDFGVQQLVSLYYNLFSNKEFKFIKYHFSIKQNDKKLLSIKETLNLNKNYRKLINEKIWKIKQFYKQIRFVKTNNPDPIIAILRTSFTKKVLAQLIEQSKNQILFIDYPSVKLTYIKPNLKKRQILLEIKWHNDFEKYLIHSLYHCFPKAFIENFIKLHNVFKNDIETRKFTHIVSEFWISEIPTSIYVALSQILNRKFISVEHGASMCYYDDNVFRIEPLTVDKYLTTGWRDKSKKVVPGGFVCRDSYPYKFNHDKKTILYIIRTKLPFTYEFGNPNMVNKIYVQELSQLKECIFDFPQKYKKYLKIRPRYERFFWDVEKCLGLSTQNVHIDHDPSFTHSLDESRLVIIDHLSTGFGEIITKKVPFLLFYDLSLIPISQKYLPLFDKLKEVGILHENSDSLHKKLLNVYPCVENWWTSKAVQTAINNLVKATLAPPKKTIDYLLSLITK